MAARRRSGRRLSQHFLVDRRLQRRIVDALDPGPEDVVIEIGPGQGALTRHLVDRVGRLILVELDDALAQEMEREFRDRADVRVVRADILETMPAALADGADYTVIGNIPYAITSPLIFHLLDQRPLPEVAVLTLQREVADRLTAAPSSKDFGALTVGVQALASVERLFTIGRGAFRPPPDVESAVVRVTPRRPPPLTDAAARALRRLTRAAFSRRRKQLQKVLRTAPEYRLDRDEAIRLLEDLGISPATRPDALPVEGYLRLATALSGR